MYQSDYFLLGKGRQKSGGWRVSRKGRRRTRSRGTFWDGGVKFWKMFVVIRSRHCRTRYKGGKGQGERSRGVVFNDGRWCWDDQIRRCSRASVGTKGQVLCWVGGRGTSWLNVMQCGEGCGLTEGCVGEVAFGGSVDAQNHPREVHIKSHLVAAKESTPGLRYMCAKTVKGYPKCQNMEDIVDKKTLTVE
jgi:hypothetical protein